MAARSSCSVSSMRLVTVLVGIFVSRVSSATPWPALTLRINGAQGQINTDTLVAIGSSLRISCEEGGTSVDGCLFFNDIDVDTAQYTLFGRQSDGSWTIHSMSLEHQGSYKCCVQARCEEIALIIEFKCVCVHILAFYTAWSQLA